MFSRVSKLFSTTWLDRSPGEVDGKQRHTFDTGIVEQTLAFSWVSFLSEFR